MTIALASAEDLVWRENWKRDITVRARTWAPAMFHAHRLESPTTPAPPATPIPVTPKLPQTDEIRRVTTEMIPAVKLFAPVVKERSTTDVISSAVRQYYERHGFPPRFAVISAAREQWISFPEFYPVSWCDRADIGCFTIEVMTDADIDGDMVWLVGKRYVWSERVGEYYL